MNVSTITAYIGKRGLLRGDSVPYSVRVTDAKASYGVLRVFVVAEAGNGDGAWVQASRVEFAE